VIVTLQAETGNLNPLHQSSNGSSSLWGQSDLFQTGPSLTKLSLSSVLLSQPPPSLATSAVSQVAPVSMSALVSAVRSPVLQPPTPNMAGPIRRRISDKSALSLAGGESSSYLNISLVLVHVHLTFCKNM
jgi:hypothetical protein